MNPMKSIETAHRKKPINDDRYTKNTVADVFGMPQQSAKKGSRTAGPVNTESTGDALNSTVGSSQRRIPKSQK